MPCIKPNFLALMFLICISDSAIFAFDFGVPYIPSASCSFEGGKLCPGIPGNVVQQNFQQGECGSSLARLCGNVSPGEGRLANCLRENGHLIDEQCAAWGRRVGLDFAAGKPKKLNNPKSVSAAKDSEFGGGGQTADPCFGSAWFNNPNCQKAEIKAESSDLFGTTPEEKGLSLPKVEDLYPMPGSMANPPSIFDSGDTSGLLNSIEIY